MLLTFYKELRNGHFFQLKHHLFIETLPDHIFSSIPFPVLFQALTKLPFDIYLPPR